MDKEPVCPACKTPLQLIYSLSQISKWQDIQTKKCFLFQDADMSCLFSPEGKYTKRALTNSPAGKPAGRYCYIIVPSLFRARTGSGCSTGSGSFSVLFSAGKRPTISGQHFINICVDLCLKILANLRLQHAVHFFRIKCLFDKLFSNRAFNLWHEYSPFAGILPRYQSGGRGRLGMTLPVLFYWSFSAAASSILRRI